MERLTDGLKKILLAGIGTVAVHGSALRWLPLSQLSSQSAGYHPSSRHMDCVPQAM